MTAAIAARGFVFVLAVFGLIIAALLPAAGGFVLIHRHTHRPAAYWLFLVGFLLYAAAVAVGITAVIINSGLAAWVAA